jgi:hypothetical protein
MRVISIAQRLLKQGSKKGNVAAASFPHSWCKLLPNNGRGASAGVPRLHLFFLEADMGDLTLREALASKRLDAFVREQQDDGAELVTGSELERGLALLITQRSLAEEGQLGHCPTQNKNSPGSSEKPGLLGLGSNRARISSFTTITVL